MKRQYRTPDFIVKTYDYHELLEYYADNHYQTLDDDQINRLIALFIRSKDKYDQEEIVSEATYGYYRSVLDALEGKIDALELGQKLMKTLTDKYKDQINNDYYDVQHAYDRSDEGELFWEDHKQRGADLKATQSYPIY